MSLKPRIFIHNDNRLPDPDPSKPPQEIKDIYAAQYPELTNATYVFSKDKDTGADVYTFKASAGTKG